MRWLTSSRALVGVAAIIVTTPTFAGESFTSKVVSVADGDTITVLKGKTQMKIRLHGVDTPEKAQPFGKKAKQFTSRLVFGKKVKVEVVPIGKHGRTVAKVFIGETSLNEELVKAGLAWWYRKYAAKDKKLASLEAEAQKAKRGLWVEQNPVAPWAWRQGVRVGSRIKGGRGYSPPIRGDLHGNIRSKVFHGPSCKNCRCKNCTAVFKSVAAAKKAGYRPHKECVSAVTAAPKPPKLSWSKDRVCKHDKDCVVHDRHVCDPCPQKNPAWRTPVSQTTMGRWYATWSIIKCRVIDCSKTRWLGSKAVCTGGQCQIRP